MSLRAAVPLYQHRGLVLVTGPTAEPVSAADLRLHLREEASAFPDAGAYVTEAREAIESRLGLAMMSQTWKLALDRWPATGEAWWDGVREGSITELYGSATYRSVELPRWPLQSITSLTTYNEASTPTSLTPTAVFDIDTYQVPGRMTLKSGQTWPVALRPSNAIEIVFVAGYASTDTVPASMKRAIKQLAAFNYTHRGDTCDPGEAFTASGAASLMAPYVPWRV